MDGRSSIFSLPGARTLFAICLAALFFTSKPDALYAQQSDSLLTVRFQLAQSYIRAGQFERAITLLEDLYAAHPTTHAFYDHLKDSYENVKRYDDALALVEERIRQEPANAVYAAEMARLLYLKGDEQEAYDTWNEAIALEPDNRNVYRVVYQSMVQVREIERAIQVLEAGREAIGEKANFHADLANLYTTTGQFDLAIEEYLGLLAQNDRQFAFVRGRLGSLSEQKDALKISIAATERAVRQTPLNRAFRELLAWLYLEAGEYRKALDANRAIDRLEDENGNVLFAFAQSAADAGAYDVALDAYEEILKRYPDAPAAPDAKAGLGAMHEKWAQKTYERAYDAEGNRIPAPHYQMAIDTYQAFLQKYPNHPYYPEILRRIGHLQQEVFFDMGAAEATLKEVSERYGNTAAADLAELDRGRIALMRGQLDEARVAFTRLVERLRTGDLADDARYELALLHFYRGEFEAAQTLLAALNANTDANVANDAIEMKVLLIENKGPDSLNVPLRMFARAHLLERQRTPDESIQALDSLLQTFGAHPLADDSRFFKARLLRATGHTQEAFAAFIELPLMHPASFLADRSLFMAAEILEQELNARERAIQMYTRLLTDYPGSLLTSEARARIRTLREDGA